MGHRDDRTLPGWCHGCCGWSRHRGGRSRQRVRRSEVRHRSRCAAHLAPAHPHEPGRQRNVLGLRFLGERHGRSRDRPTAWASSPGWGEAYLGRHLGGSNDRLGQCARVGRLELLVAPDPVERRLPGRHPVRAAVPVASLGSRRTGCCPGEDHLALAPGGLLREPQEQRSALVSREAVSAPRRQGRRRRDRTAEPREPARHRREFACAGPAWGRKRAPVRGLAAWPVRRKQSRWALHWRSLPGPLSVPVALTGPEPARPATSSRRPFPLWRLLALSTPRRVLRSNGVRRAPQR